MSQNYEAVTCSACVGVRISFSESALCSWMSRAVVLCLKKPEFVPWALKLKRIEVMHIEHKYDSGACDILSGCGQKQELKRIGHAQSGEATCSPLCSRFW